MCSKQKFNELRNVHINNNAFLKEVFKKKRFLIFFLII